jgi:hypothetical protein
MISWIWTLSGVWTRSMYSCVVQQCCQFMIIFILCDFPYLKWCWEKRICSCTISWAYVVQVVNNNVNFYSWHLLLKVFFCECLNHFYFLCIWNMIILFCIFKLLRVSIKNTIKIKSLGISAHKFWYCSLGSMLLPVKKKRAFP